MRRKDREITDRSEIEKILENAFVCHLGLTDGTTPYVVPMNFAYKCGCIYLHCASEGKRLDIIRKNNMVCFQVEITPGSIIENGDQACDWGVKFLSVIGFGKAEILEANADKLEGLTVFMGRFSGNKFTFPESEIAATTVIRITIEEMSGKAANE